LLWKDKRDVKEKVGGGREKESIKKRGRDLVGAVWKTPANSEGETEAE